MEDKISLTLDVSMVPRCVVTFGKSRRLNCRWKIESAKSSGYILLLELVLQKRGGNYSSRTVTLDTSKQEDIEFNVDTNILTWRDGKYLVNLMMPQSLQCEDEFAFDA